MTKITGTLHEDQHTFYIYFAHFFLERKMFETKFVAKLETHKNLVSIFFV
jgi:hypothetical protein